MESRDKEETHEISAVSIANASSDPRAVMVVDFNANPTSITVESTGRPDNFACVTVGEFIMLMFFFLLGPKILKFLKVEKFCCVIIRGNALFAQSLLKFFPRLIGYVVL